MSEEKMYEEDPVKPKKASGKVVSAPGPDHEAYWDEELKLDKINNKEKLFKEVLNKCESE